MNLLYFLAFIWDRVRVSGHLGRDLFGDFNKRGMRMKSWLAILLLCLVPMSAFAEPCENNEDCGENEVCMEKACPPCEEGEECPPCESECVEVGDAMPGVDIAQCADDSECPFGMACVETEVPCMDTVPVPIDGGCACPECPEGEEDCPPCDCEDEEEEAPETEVDEDCPEGVEIVSYCQPAPCDETTTCGENFVCAPFIEECTYGSSPGSSGGSSSDPGEPEGEDAGDGETTDSDGEDATDEDPAEEEPTEDESSEEEPIVEEAEGGEGDEDEGDNDEGNGGSGEWDEDWEEECEVIAEACLPDELPCATDEECPTDWECVAMSEGPVTVDIQDCACEPCEEGDEDCPPCECDEVEEEVVVEEEVSTEGMCLPLSLIHI